MCLRAAICQKAGRSVETNGKVSKKAFAGFFFGRDKFAPNPPEVLAEVLMRRSLLCRGWGDSSSFLPSSCHNATQ